MKWLVTLEKKNENKYLVLDMLMKTKKFQRNMKKFGKVLKMKLEQLMVAKKLNMGKVLKKLGSSLMMICQWINR